VAQEDSLQPVEEAKWMSRKDLVRAFEPVSPLRPNQLTRVDAQLVRHQEYWVNRH
jgi:hypothetical protein